LRDGALLISNSRNQTETLESLLAACSSLTPACGLMVLRGAQASGWSSIGLGSPESFKGATMDTTRGAVVAVLNSCSGRVAKVSELDPAFTARLGLESSAEVLLLPVILKERVAALLLALSGDSEDLAGLEVLVQLAQLALELQGHRKATAQTSAQTPTEAQQRTETQRATAGQSATAPEAAYAAGPPSTPPEIARPTPEPSYAYASASAAPSASAGAETSPSPAGNQPAAALDEAHERGRRFAKLLVEEIKLYNQAKVSEGRAQRDLYSRLREDIEKSRAAYQKRYGEIVKDVDYFTEELMRILADNDRTIMGAGFPG
jgi:hypothetical protein